MNEKNLFQEESNTVKGIHPDEIIILGRIICDLTIWYGQPHVRGQMVQLMKKTDRLREFWKLPERPWTRMARTSTSRRGLIPKKVYPEKGLFRIDHRRLHLIFETKISNLDCRTWTDRVSMWKTSKQLSCLNIPRDPALSRQSVNLPKINDRDLLKRVQSHLNSTKELC